MYHHRRFCNCFLILIAILLVRSKTTWKSVVDDSNRNQSARHTLGSPRFKELSASFSASPIHNHKETAVTKPALIRERNGGDWTLSRVGRAPAFSGKDAFETRKVEAVLNTTALLPCRPLNKSSEESKWNEESKGTLLWKRISTNEYLIHDNRRLHPDTRYILDMSSFDQTIMDLRIDNVQRKDEGEYLCLYSTGQNVYKRRIDLTVLVPPIIYENSSSSTRVVVQEGETTVLHCKAWGVPQPTLTWHSMPQDGPRRQISLTTDTRFSIQPNQLVISNVSRSLHGLYKCLATNGLEQTAQRVMELDVQFPPTIKMANQKIGQSIHRTTMVRALIRGNPINAFYWEFDRRPIYGPNSNCLIPMPNEKYCVSVDKVSATNKEVKTTLFISNLTSEDYGAYSCVVETPFGIFRNSTEVFRTHPTSVSAWDKYASGSLSDDDNNNNNLLLPNPEIISRKINEKMNKRATYLTIGAPRPERSRLMEQQPGSESVAPCLRDACKSRTSTAMSTYTHSHPKFRVLASILIGTQWVIR